MRFELFVALRYLFARRKQAFIYIISAMSVLGVAIGVAALVVVLGVYNGFTTDIRDKILGANAHIIVSGPLAALTAPPSDADFEKMRGGEAPELSGMAAVLRRINATPGVVGSTPFLYAEGMLSSPRGVKGVVLRGIDPKTAPDVLTMLDNLSSGSVAGLNASVEGAPPGVLIGKELAQRLGLVVGSRVNLLSPSGQKTTAGFQPRIRPYKVAGIFQTGMFEYDSSLGFISLAAARDLLGLPSDQISGIEVTVKDVYKADTVAAALQKELGPLASVRTWMDMNANLFAALKLEKIGMFILLAMVVLHRHHAGHAGHGKDARHRHPDVHGRDQGDDPPDLHASGYDHRRGGHLARLCARHRAGAPPPTIPIHQTSTGGLYAGSPAHPAQLG